MISKKPGEIWKHLRFSGYKEFLNCYALSTLGRIASFKKDMFKDGKLLNGSLTTGYRTLNLHRPGKRGTLYIHREMAKLFLNKTSPKYKYVIHKNHNKLDNNIKNLKWVTLQEMIQHQQNSPAKVAYKKLQANRDIGLKLNANQVQKIKSQLTDERRILTIRQIAEKYKVSEMTMYRIKSGENWGRIRAKA